MLSVSLNKTFIPSFLRSRFQVNLINGDSLDDDVALVINPRRDEGEVVLNNCVDGEWQDEEREELPTAFQDMLPFEVKVVTKKNKFKVMW